MGSQAWTFHDILLRLLTDHGGKFVIGDQCAYGARDQETGRPVRKTTGYITNSDAIANAWSTPTSEQSKQVWATL